MKPETQRSRATTRTPRPLHALVDDGSIRLRYAVGTGDTLIVSFSSIGRRRAELPPDEFLGSILRTPKWHGLFVSDVNRSWMGDAALCDTLSETLAILRKDHAITRVITIGLSMGAFSALVASALFPVDAAVAISPQFSMMPKHIPGETRWRYWRKRLAPPRFETAEVASAATRSYAFHGLQDDLKHMQAFTPRQGLDQFAFADQSHSSLGRHLRDQGALTAMIQAAAEGDRRAMARLVKSCGGGWRGAL